MTQQDGTPRRAFYGLAEAADALGLNRQLVTVWRRRRSRGIPEPDAELSSGPIWRGETIEPWIDRMRAELGRDTGVAPLSPEVALRLARRVLRLLVLTLEEQPRPRPLAQAAEAVEELRAAVETTARDETGQAAREVFAALSPGDPGSVRARLTEVLPAVGRVISSVTEAAPEPPSSR